MAKSASTEVATQSDNDYLPLDIRPDYLPEALNNSGMGNLDKDDYKTPRIILLQGLSPELEAYPGIAKKDQFWHTGLNINLGPEFVFVPAVANKRVILFRPRSDQGGGIIAFSRDGKNWDTGANSEFKVKLKGKKEPVLWRTGKNVISSRLTEWGSSDPDEANSAPAATIIYEYLAYLPKHPELSPCLISVSKTGLPNGKSFNTSLAMLVRSGTPVYAVAVRCFADSMHNDDGEWTVPNFQPIGKVQKSTYETVKEISDKYADYKVEYTDDSSNGNVIVDDEIKY